MNFTVNIEGDASGPFNIYYDTASAGTLVYSSASRENLINGLIVTGVSPTASYLVLHNLDPDCDNFVTKDISSPTPSPTPEPTPTPSPTSVVVDCTLSGSLVLVTPSPTPTLTSTPAATPGPSSTPGTTPTTTPTPTNTPSPTSSPCRCYYIQNEDGANSGTVTYTPCGGSETTENFSPGQIARRCIDSSQTITPSALMTVVQCSPTLVCTIDGDCGSCS